MPCCKSCSCRRAGAEKERRPGHATGAPAPPSDSTDGLQARFSVRAFLFVFRGLMLLLWLYMFESMRTYVTNYIGDGDSWFTKFVVFVVAVPMADLFCILGFLCLRIPMPELGIMESA